MSNNDKIKGSTIWRYRDEKLPKLGGWYIVYAPGYHGGSSSACKIVNGMMFSRYYPESERWSVESKNYNNGCVKAWMPLPAIPKKLREIGKGDGNMKLKPSYCGYCERFKGKNMLLFALDDDVDLKDFEGGYITNRKNVLSLYFRKSNDILSLGKYGRDYVSMIGDTLKFNYCPVCGKRWK